MAIPKEVEIVLERMQRKLPRYVVGIAPAIPLYAFSQGVPEDGVLLRYLFPLPGKITKLYISILGATPQRTLTVRAELSGASTGQYVEGVLRKDLTNIDAMLEVIEGSRLTVLAATAWDGPIEVAAVFIPAMGIGEMHKVLRSEIEKDQEEKQDEGA